MRVVQITCSYYPNIGGIEIFVKELNDALVKKGHSVTVYTFDRNGVSSCQDYVDKVFVRRYKPIIGDPVYLPALSFLRDIRNDPSTVLHIHDIHSLLFLMVALFKRKNQKILLQPHYHRFAQSLFRQFLFSIYKRVLNSLLLRQLPIIIANSTYEKNAIGQDFPRSIRIVLIPEGIAMKELRRLKWNPVRPKRILYAGSLRRYKNVDKIVEAFSFLMATRKEELRLIIIGEGPERAYLMNLAQDLGIQRYVEWKNGLTRQELLSEYARAQTFLLLSSLESFSRAIHEALIIGVPTIVLNKGAASELVKKGLVVGINSTQKEEVAQAINRALDVKKTEASLEELATQDMDEYSSALLRIYESL